MGQDKEKFGLLKKKWAQAVNQVGRKENGSHQ